MTGFCSLGFGVLGLSVVALTAWTPASASTMRADVKPPQQHIALADIIAVDPLGYACIREDEIDIAFHASGKGVRLPRTCLPEPCRAALTQFELAGLIGRPPLPPEWDDYFSRYADHCRKEVVPLDPDPEDEIATPADFWEPLVASYPPDAPIRTALPPRRSGPVASLPPGVPGFWVEVSEERRPSPTGPGSKDPEDELVPPVRDPIPPVPLPAGLVLLLTGVALLLRRSLRPGAL